MLLCVKVTNCGKVPTDRDNAIFSIWNSKDGEIKNYTQTEMLQKFHKYEIEGLDENTIRKRNCNKV